MSWQDRQYSGDDSGGYGGGMRFALPRPTSAVKWLLIANVVLYLVDLISQNSSMTFWHETFGLNWVGLFSGKIWQPVTYMFVHNDMMHLLSNMLILYFFGMSLEQTLGRDRFVKFFGMCGVIGGFAYLLLSLVSSVYRFIPLIGASGGCFGLIVAAMIFFPQMQIIFFFVPMTVRVFGLLMLGIHFLPLLGPSGRGNFGGEICHMAGALAGVGVLYVWGMIPGMPFRFGGGLAKKIQNGAWQRKLELEERDQTEVDRILAKVSQSGIQSLSRGERKTLETATKRQQEQDRKTYR